MRSLRRISCLQCRTEIVLASFNHGIITLKKNVDQRVKDPDKVKAFRVYLYFQRIPILVHLTISFHNNVANINRRCGIGEISIRNTVSN